MELKTFGVVGAGQMGNGIAQVAAMSGLQVIMNDIKDEFVQRGLKNITNILSKNVDKGKMTAEEKDAILGRIKTSVQLKDMAAADYVVEAATENEADQTTDLPGPRCHLQARSHPRYEYLFDSHRSHCGGDKTA